jgi:hypothetical protein
MSEIDKRLEKFVSLPFSFEAVIGDMASNHQDQVDLPRYVNYLLDDSTVPDNVCEVIKPAGIASNMSWEAMAAHCKLMLFNKGAADGATTTDWSDGYHENNFLRLDMLNDEPNSTIRLQLKDDIIMELVRAYMEGFAASQEINKNSGPLGRDVRLAQLADAYRKNRCINTRIKKRLFAPGGKQPVVTFFMLVTDGDILIADYCIKSFSLLSGLDFKLVAYCNWIKPENRAKYFPKWRKNYSFVEIIEPEWMTEANRPCGASYYGYGFEGPYERNEVLWDSELPKFMSRYHVTFDGDFEILNQGFMRAMLDRLESNATAGLMGTDMDADMFFTDHEHPGKNIQYSVVNTWCCIYKRETLSCKVSHLYYREKSRDDGINLNVWDSSGVRQLALRHIHGYESSIVDPGYQVQFIHYGAFSKNRHLDDSNIEMWRQLMILRKIGHPNVLNPKFYSQCQADLRRLLERVGIRPNGSENVSELAALAYKKLFSHVDGSNPYKDGWGDLRPV